MPDFSALNWKWIAVAWCAAVSCIAFVLHGVDKRRARHNRRRIAERTLHLFELLGGWLGAWVAMLTFRHKTQKRSYRVVFALIVVLHLGLWGLWMAATW